jgi:DNA repair exonuclease SbcCD ATPase subunit
MLNEQPNQYETPRRSRIGTMPLLFALFCLGGVALGIWVKDRQQIDAVNAERAQMAANLNQALAQSKSQVQELNSRLDTLMLAQARAQAPAAKPAARIAKGPARRKPLVANDPRVDKLQGQLSETQQELARTRDDVNKTRDDLNGSIAKTRDDLNGSIAQTRDELAKSHNELAGQITSARSDLGGSIAKTHDEVLALRKRGEQNVYEFHLDKSKQFERVGPLSLALRATNPKHKTYDVAMVVEDNTLSKKHVNLYEPIWIRMTDRPQAVELVVNRVDKDRITGYVTEPKYKRSELASTSEKAPEKLQQLETR